VRYFISSLRLGVKLFAGAVRGHWGIENTLHWCLGAAARRASFPTALSASPDEGVSVGSHVVHARRKVFFAEFDL
jgi:hypothetical protein